MYNLVLNQNGVYTYRKSVLGTSIRVSLQTKDKFEAIRVTDKVNSLLDLASSNDPVTVKSIIYSAVSQFQPTFKKERLDRVQGLLGINLEQDNGEFLSVVVKKFVEEKLRSKAWTDKTFATYKVIFDTLTDFIPDKGIKLVSHKDAQSVKNSLQQLPSSMNKRAQYKGKTIKQILRMKIPDSHLMSIKTINTRLGCYSELFKWAIKNGYVDVNVFEGLGLRDNRNSRDLRLPFSPADLKVLFSDPAISSPDKPWQYWLPLLGLFTGARLNELCQLLKQDLQQVNGIWCINITDQGENQHLKSNSSRRLIPVHNKLLELGFVDYVRRQSGGKRSLIFPEFTLRNERYSHTSSKWFGHVKQRLLTDSSKKTFHSFRHTFIDYLFNKLKLQGNPLVKALVGHADREITSGVYGSSFDVDDLDKIIQQLNFDEFGILFRAP